MSGKLYRKEKKLQKEEDDYTGYKNWIELSIHLEDKKSLNYQDFIKEATCITGNMDKKNTIFKKVKEKLSQSIGFFKENILIAQRETNKILKNRAFFIVILVSVFLNSAIMATEFTNQPLWLNKFQDSANILFVIVFILEFLLKIFGFGIRGYFSKLFNIFDFFVLLSSLIELILMMTKVIPSIGLMVLRCARLLRIFKLTPFWNSMRRLLKDMASALKAALSLLILVSLIMAIFALLGMQLFGGRFTFSTITRTNFDTFVQSIFTVFQVIISQDWNLIMYDGMRSYSDTPILGGFMALYFITLYIVGNYTFLNVFLAIALKNLEGDDDTVEDEIESTITESTVSNTFNIVNGCVIMPAYVSTDILAINKVRDKTKKNDNEEKRVRIHFKKNNTKHEMQNSELENGLDNEINTIEDNPNESDFSVVDDATTEEDFMEIPSGSSCFLFQYNNRFRMMCYKLVNNKLFKNILLSQIILSSLMLAVEDPLTTNASKNNLFQRLDNLFTGIFVFEIMTKMIAYGIILHKNSFLRNGSNWLDLIVVTAGLIDNIISSEYQLSAVKMLRILRVLRPLRSITEAKGLKRIIQCLSVALKSIINIVLFALLLEFMFAVIGVIILKGGLYSCSDPSKFTNRTCQGLYFSYTMDGLYTLTIQSRTWSNNPLNFDNVPIAMLTIFTISAFNGWKTFLYKSIDSKGENLGPYQDYNKAMFFFYLAVLVTIAFFTFNIFIGLVIITYKNEKESEYIEYKLDKNERNCISFVLKARPEIRYIPKTKFRYIIWKFISSKRFEYFMLCVIILNTIALGVKYMNQPQIITNTLQYLNMAFVIIFTVEVLLKIYVFHIRNFFDDSMNIFDVLVILGSYVDLIFTIIQSNENSVRINLFRLFRVLRIIKILNKHKSIRQLLWTFIKSIRSLPYVILLIILFYYMYAVIGTQLFGKIGTYNSGSSINRNYNFQSFPNALITLFRAMTGESWPDVMMSCVDGPKATCLNSTDSCGSWMAYIFFPSFLLLCSFMMMNLFVAIIMENFNYLTRDKSILSPHHLEKFVNVWSQYDIKASGRIRYIDLVNLLLNINPPLGFGKMCSQLTIFRKLIRMNVPLQNDGTVLFSTVLFSLVRNNFKMNLIENERDIKKIKEFNKELRNIIKACWKNINPSFMDQIIPPNVNESLTVGKMFAVSIIKKWFKLNKSKKPNSSLPLSQDICEENISHNETCNHIKNKPVEDDIPISTSSLSSQELKTNYEKFTEYFWKGFKDIFSKSQEKT